MSNVEYHAPRTVQEACELVERYGEDSRVLAGGTALVLLMRQRLLSPACLINIQRIESLGGISGNGGGLSIGALTTHAQAAASSAVRGLYPALADTFAHVATPRIRNAGTVGGNLAHGDPHLDPPVTLLALDARVGLESIRGQRELSLEQFFVDYYETALEPGELVTRVRLPPRAPRSGLSFIKFLPRSQDDYATVDVAAWVRVAEDGSVADARLALGSVGPVVFRAREAEVRLKGERLADGVLAEAGELAAAASDPEDDVRGSAAYKRELIKVLVGRAVRQAAEEAK